jgi:UDP-N-acetylmuramoylalanine-D-glutamate ligase
MGHLALVDMKAEMEEDVLRDAPEGQTFAFIDGVDLPGDQADWPSLAGPHNRANAQAAVARCASGSGRRDHRAGAEKLCGLPHRMERVGEAHGVTFINDSKATNPASTAPALPPFRRSRGIGASTGSWAACPRVWIWTIARAVLPMSRRPIRLVMRGRCSPRFLPPHARRAPK